MKHRLASMVVASIFIASGGAANASLQTVASCSVAGGSTLDIGNESSSCSMQGAHSPYDWWPELVMTGTSTATATAQYGVLKAKAFSQGVTSWGSGSSTTAMFSDYITVYAEEMSGKTGVATFLFAHDWVATQSYNGADGWSQTTTTFSVMAAELPGATASHRTYQLDTSLGVPQITAINSGQTVAADAPIVLEVPFYFNTPFRIDMSLTASAGGGPNGTLLGTWDAEMDAANSAYWGGLQSLVTDTKLTGPVTILGASGTDYSASMIPAPPVPEPSAIALLSVGLSILGMSGRLRWLPKKLTSC